ncbi:hypothetical protein, partial [Desulfovibrio sp.]|uniref:hypothetical protein n=1 Tax=Desulfovibrio sp. TaxID=885 RepID=UPI002A90C168
LVEEFSELAHSLLLLPRQFYGTTLPCFSLYPLEKTGTARCMPDILLWGYFTLLWPVSFGENWYSKVYAGHTLSRKINNPSSF